MGRKNSQRHPSMAVIPAEPSTRDVMLIRNPRIHGRGASFQYVSDGTRSGTYYAQPRRIGLELFAGDLSIGTAATPEEAEIALYRQARKDAVAYAKRHEAGFRDLTR